MVPLEYPPRPEGPLPEQVRQLWEALFRLVEALNAGQHQPDGSHNTELQ